MLKIILTQVLVKTMLPLIILDLDATLIRCTKDWWNKAPHSSFRLEGEVYHLYMRPHLQKFLDALYPHKIAVWTSAVRSYAKCVVRRIFGPCWRHRIAFLYHRKHCTVWKNTFVKDLRKVDQDCLLIDDDPSHFKFKRQFYPQDYKHRIYNCQAFMYHDDVELLRLARMLRFVTSITQA